MLTGPKTAAFFTRIVSFSHIILISFLLLSVCSSCNLCALIGCEERPHSSIYFNDWVGEYSKSTIWHGTESREATPIISGSFYVNVAVKEKDSSLQLQVHVSSNPGKILEFETFADTVTDSLLGFNFTDNWGAKGLGQLFRLNDGSFQLNTDIVDDLNMATSGMLYGRHNVLKTVPDKENNYNTKAEAYYQQQQYDKAIRLSQILLDEFPNNPRALGNIGLFHLKSNNYQAAKHWMEIALGRLKTPEKRAEVYYNRALLAAAEKQEDVAALYFKISYYLRQHPAVREKLKAVSPQDDLPKPIKLTHPNSPEDFLEFQQLLYKKENHFLRPEDIPKLYYSIPEGEIVVENIIAKTHQEFITEAVYTIENIRDDATSGLKFNLFLVRVNHQWEVLDIRFSFKCHADRGHTDWGTENCL